MAPRMREDKLDPKRWPHQQPAVLAAGMGEWTLSGPETSWWCRLERLGRDTLGLLGADQPGWPSWDVERKVLDMPVTP